MWGHFGDMWGHFFRGYEKPETPYFKGNFGLLFLETVGVEDDSQAETRSRRGLQDFFSVGEHLGERF